MDLSENAKRVRAQPLSDFATKVLEDHSGLSVAESKVVADNMLRCADFLTQHKGTCSSSSSSRPT